MSNPNGFGGPGQPPGAGHPPPSPDGVPPWGVPQANPGAGPAPAGQGQPGYGYGYGPQGQVPPGQPPHPGYVPPGGYGQPPHGQPPYGQPYPGYGQVPPQGQPYPGHGYAPPGGYPQHPGYPPPQASQNPFDGIGAPTNAWIPGALVSFFLPGIGLMLIGRPEYKALAIKIFVGYIALVIGSIVFTVVMTIFGLGLLSSLVGLVLSVAPFASLIHTHDMTVKAYPHLGKPIFFKS